MPRFFNRIRKQLAKENKFFQYSRYAIGEFVLVVIGILLALQINTWNQGRISRVEEQKYLKRLRQAGLTRLHVGLETGCAELLRKVEKGATPEDFVEAGKKVKEAGFELSLYILLGLGGEDLSEAHARGTAAVLNRIDPHFIRVRTVQPQPGYRSRANSSPIPRAAAAAHPPSAS